MVPRHIPIVGRFDDGGGFGRLSALVGGLLVVLFWLGLGFNSGIERQFTALAMPFMIEGEQIGGIVLAAIVVLGVGALTLLLSEEILKAITDHWMAILGPLIVLVVLTAKRGLYGFLLDWDAYRARRESLWAVPSDEADKP